MAIVGPGAARVGALALTLLSCACSDAPDEDSVTLVVLTPDEEPIAGVHVTTDDGIAVGETDATGACTLVVPEQRERIELDRIELHLEKDGFAHGSVSAFREPEMLGILEPLRTIRGRVLAADMRMPVPAARLTLPHAGCRRCAPVEFIADADGRFELAGGEVELAYAEVSVVAPGFARNRLAIDPSRVSAPLEHDFVLERGLELGGRVVDFESGLGLGGAEVDGMRADETGNFVVRVLPVQDFVEFSVRAAGHCALWAKLARADVERHEPMRLPLARGTALEGTLRDPAGRPVAGTKVQVWGYALDPGSRESPGFVSPAQLAELPRGSRFERDSSTPWEPSTDVTDDAGHFSFEGLPPWSRGLVVSADDGRFRHAVKTLASIAGPGERTRVELTLEAERYPETQEISVAVRVNGFETDLPGEISWKGRTREGRASLKSESRLSVEGGAVSVHVDLDDFPGSLPGDGFVIPAPRGFNPHPLDVRVPAKPIAGRVQFEDGPAVRVRVSARCDGLVRATCTRPCSLSKTVRTDADGRFRFEAPDFGVAYRIEVTVGEQVHTLEVLPGRTDVDFDLRRPGTLLVRVVDARSGRLVSVREAAVSWRSAAELQLHHLGWGIAASPTAEGWLRLRVPNGELELVAWPESEAFRPCRGRTVRLSSTGEPARVELALEPGVELGVRLDATCGELPSGYDLLLVEESGVQTLRAVHSDECLTRAYETVETQPFVLRELHFDATGSAVARGLAPGRHCFRVFPTDVSIEPETIEITEGTNEPVLLRWRRAR